MKETKERMVQAIVRIPQKYVKMAQEVAAKELRSYSSVLRRAIVEWLDVYKIKGN